MMSGGSEARASLEPWDGALAGCCSSCCCSVGMYATVVVRPTVRTLRTPWEPMRARLLPVELPLDSRELKSPRVASRRSLQPMTAREDSRGETLQQPSDSMETARGPKVGGRAGRLDGNTAAGSCRAAARTS